jgi:hypothetical protein
MKVKDEVLACGSFQIMDGTQARFWEDTWASTRSFKEIFPALYNTAHYPRATVASVMSTIPINVSFRRALIQEKLIDWHNLVTMISNFRLQEGNDRFNWNLCRDEPSPCALCTLIDWIVLHPTVTKGFGN